MLRTRIKRDARSGEQALRRLVEIEASLAKLTDEDILDLADIFATSGISRSVRSPLRKWSGATSAFSGAAEALSAWQPDSTVLHRLTPTTSYLYEPRPTCRSSSAKTTSTRRCAP